MVMLKEYRIVMPVTVDEYKVAQIYMTAKTQSMEAEQPNGAGVEILETTDCVHPTMGPGIYTKKHYHIERRFPGWLRAIAPKSGMTLIETAHNCYPHVLTELRLPLFHKFLMRVETIHANDRGDTFNIHNLDEKKLKQREIVYIDISEKDDHHKKKKMYDKDNTDPRSFKSERTGRGPLVGNWQSACQPVMCAYKLVTCEFDYWPFQHKIEEFMHSYERSIFLNANRSMFCWMDEWHGLSVEEVRLYEELVTDRTNKITAIKEGKLHGRIEDIPEVHPPNPSTADTSKSAADKDKAVTLALEDIVNVNGTSDVNGSAEEANPDAGKPQEKATKQDNDTKQDNVDVADRSKSVINGDLVQPFTVKPEGGNDRMKEVEEKRGAPIVLSSVSAPIAMEEPKENRNGEVKVQMSDTGGQTRKLKSGSSISLPENLPNNDSDSSWHRFLSVPHLSLPQLSLNPGPRAAPPKKTRLQQRIPQPHEPVCCVPGCGKYGQYEIILSGQAVCSIECKLEVQPRQDSLPKGWEQRFDEEGRVFYVDHVNCLTQWNKPDI
uniref:WW domain-containing protein n=1 Tax=Hanusia phi TaxID=3032 RepID=A0A7S0EYJ1_9CRYP